MEITEGDSKTNNVEVEESEGSEAVISEVPTESIEKPKKKCSEKKLAQLKKARESKQLKRMVEKKMKENEQLAPHTDIKEEKPIKNIVQKPKKKIRFKPHPVPEKIPDDSEGEACEGKESEEEEEEEEEYTSEEEEYYEPPPPRRRRRNYRPRHNEIKRPRQYRQYEYSHGDQYYPEEGYAPAPTQRDIYLRNLKSQMFGD